MEIVIKIPDEEYKNICLMSKDGIGMALYDWIANGTPIEDWLNSFNTDSATKCFEAVNILKERLKDEVSD